MRNFITCFINGKRHKVESEQAFMSVGDYLRYIKNLTGTKIVCAEGDCGACTILISRIVKGEWTPYVSVNSCIAKMYLMEGCHLITVEGLGSSIDMHPIQESFVDAHGTQCGYCTPGFICSMANMANDLKESGLEKSEQKVKNYLTGNLCRCTGYESIIKAGMDLNLTKTKPLCELYNDTTLLKNYLSIGKDEIKISFGSKEVYLPLSFESACEYKTADVKLISGATDLGVIENKGKFEPTKILSLNLIDEAYEVDERLSQFEIGAKVSLSEIESYLADSFREFSNLLHIFASPQIKNVGTLVGNVVNASPIADTIPFLLVSHAKLKLVSTNGERIVEVNDFYKEGYKQLDLLSDELVKSIIIPKSEHEYKLYKVSIRKDLDISTVTFASRYKVDNGVITDLDLAFGGVGPKVLRTPKLESQLKGKTLDSKLFIDHAKLVQKEIAPLSDHRGSDKFRFQLCENLIRKFGDELIGEISSGDVEASI